MGIEVKDSRGKRRALGNATVYVKCWAYETVDADVGLSVEEKGVDRAEKKSRKIVDVEFVKNAGMPDSVKGLR